MFLITKLSLTKSLANLGKSTFESILREELWRERADLPLGGFIRPGGSPDGDSVDIRIEKVEKERYRGKIKITVHVLFDAIFPVKNKEVTRSHCEGRFTVVLDSSADGVKSPKAYHVFDTHEIYPDEDALPMPTAEEESELAEIMERVFRKLEASIQDAQYPTDVRKFIGIVQRESGRAHSQHMQSILADLRRRLDLLPRPEGDDV